MNEQPMTIADCRKRKREFRRMLADIELYRLALLRNIACEDLNIADLKKKQKQHEHGRHIAYEECVGCQYNDKNHLLCQRPKDTKCKLDEVK